LAFGSPLIGRTFNTCEPCTRINARRRLDMGRIGVDLSDELEKQLRLKTVEKFGGKKGDLSRAVEDAIKTWIVTKK